MKKFHYIMLLLILSLIFFSSIYSQDNHENNSKNMIIKSKCVISVRIHKSNFELKNNYDNIYSLSRKILDNNLLEDSNPKIIFVTNSDGINISSTYNDNQIFTYLIYDLQGRILFKDKVNICYGDNFIKLNYDIFIKGKYFILLYNSNSKINSSFII